MLGAKAYVLAAAVACAVSGGIGYSAGTMRATATAVAACPAPARNDAADAELRRFTDPDAKPLPLTGHAWR